MPARSTSSAVGKSVAVTWNTFSPAATFAWTSKIVSFFGSSAIASPSLGGFRPAPLEPLELRPKPGAVEDARVGDVGRHLAAQDGEGVLRTPRSRSRR